MKNLISVASLFLLALVLLTTGCGNDDQARLRVVHASPDAPAVDVLLDGGTVASNAAYKASTEYLTIKAGSRRVEVRPTGTSSSVIDLTPQFAKDTDTTAIALGRVANIELLALPDDNTQPPSGQIKLRIVHAAPSAGNVDVYVTAPNADINTSQPNLTNVPFKAASAYLAVPAGSYRVRVTPTNTKVVAIDSGTVGLQAGQIRTAVAVEAPGGGQPFTAILLSDLN